MYLLTARLLLISAAIILLGCSAKARQAPANTNRLAKESSPYLLQHAHNPVDWYPWSDEAFAEAKRLKRPIFLSIGYSSCHWCHVMERESFENKDVAALLSADFICIKVDREERPDVDELYMTMVQMTAGRGGWPMSVFLTPDAKPFFGGTYFPRDDFKQLLARVAEVWKTKNAEVLASAEQITAALRRAMDRRSPAGSLPNASSLKTVIESLRNSFDPKNGGFGTRPKFPPHQTLELLLGPRVGEARSMALATLDAIARGGIRDHIGGGFHRYSTDERWFLPHFEKMLYDNALLARAYTQAYQITKKPLYRQVAVETLDWVLRDMRGPEGGFYSALDADSEGEEGKFYVWRRAEIEDLLGAADAKPFCDIYGVADGGNHKEEATGKSQDTNVIYLPFGPTEEAFSRKTTATELESRLKPLRAKLLEARIKRVPPFLDDKRLTSWNALMISALIRAGEALNEPRYTDAAKACAKFIIEKLKVGDTVLRLYRPASEGTVDRRIPGFLDDYAYFIDALLDLAAVDAGGPWLAEARSVAAGMVRQFADPRGGFFDSPIGHEALLVRGRNPSDSAIPSANGVAARALVRLAKLTEDTRYRSLAKSTITAHSEAMKQSPQGTITLATAALDYRMAFPKEATGAPAAPNAMRSGPVAASAALQANGSLRVTLKIDKGWHINSSKPLSKELIALSIKVDGSANRFGVPVYPRPKKMRLGFSEAPVSVYEGTVAVVVPRMGAVQKTASVTLRFQACSNRECLLPKSTTLTARKGR